MSELARISCVDAATIRRWIHRGALKVPPIGRGRNRAYTPWQAIHVAIIADMSRMGLPITGKGADLSLALLGYVRNRVARDGDVSEMGPVSLTIVPDADDWGIRPDEWMLTGESCITIGVGLIVGRVAERFEPA
ncbi:MerR family transcriptional regulator [Methylobacterium sp. V23]|uniref:MerR family transcriptional regulator n=1 Tax=Methylobacterium sp. V23 TaxID=2044878 RepID=UPI0015E1AD1C|nr:MerR family transcriptional regulator [Methylobacterium sp. V23]